MGDRPGAKPKIRLLQGLARCGGTLIARCLGSMSAIALLSEIHPRGLAQFHPLRQSQCWYGLFGAEELAKIASAATMSYAELMETVTQRFAERGQTLIVRDWSHLDFHGVPFLEKPPGESIHAAALSERFLVVPAAIVRHPLDQWSSVRGLAVVQGRIDLAGYMRGHRLFAERAALMPHVRYEDFTIDPGSTLRRLCSALEAPFDPGFAERWWRYTKVTGDRQHGPGADATAILPARRHAPSPALAEAAATNADYRRSLELLGYFHPPGTAEDEIG